MSQLKTVTCYKTSDGQIFQLAANAEAHQGELDFREWYDDNKLYGNYAGSYAKADDLLTWLRDHADVVRRLL